MADKNIDLFSLIPQCSLWEKKDFSRQNMLYLYNEVSSIFIIIHTYSYKFHIFQAEVYVNLLEGESVDESSIVEIPSINELPAKNASEKTDLPSPQQVQMLQNPIISSPIISNSVQTQSTTNNINAHFGNNIDQ